MKSKPTCGNTKKVFLHVGFFLLVKSKDPANEWKNRSLPKSHLRSLRHGVGYCPHSLIAGLAERFTLTSVKKQRFEMNTIGLPRMKSRIAEAPLSRHLQGGFTMIELLVATAIISVMIGLLLPAVQSARESARKVQCQSNLKQMGTGLQGFHSTHNLFPAGKLDLKKLGHSWCMFLLPYLEQDALSRRFDMSRSWSDVAGNHDASDSSLVLFRCASSPVHLVGGTDYCGITGGTQGGLPFGDGRDEALGSGVLVTVNDATPSFVSFRDITDGTSNTICISESVGRNDDTGRWASGDNLVATDVNPVSTPGKLSSFHSTGVYALRADGSVGFISSSIDLSVLGGLSTRNGREIPSL